MSRDEVNQALFLLSYSDLLHLQLPRDLTSEITEQK